MSQISVVVVGPTSVDGVAGNGDTVNVNVGDQTIGGGNGAAATIQAGTVAMIDATQTATVVNVGTAYAAKFNFSIPRGITGAAGAASTLSIGTVSQGMAAATITGTAPSQVLNLVLQKGDAGTPATNIELQATSTHIQWRLVGASTWTNLVALAAIMGATGSTGAAGAAGAAVELQTTSTHIQWRYVGGSTWTNVVALSSLVGATGATGATGPQGPAGTVNLADETPQPLGIASAGSALSAARADHTHATLTAFPYASLTGIPSTFAPSAHSHAVSDVTGLQTQLDGKQAAGSYAPLVNSLIPSSYLPSYVDDVAEYANLAGFPVTGETGKILVARDTGKIYRWSGSAYVEISPSPGSTDSVTEGSTNLYFTNTRAAAAAPVASVSGRTGTITLTKSDVGLGNVTNTDATSRSSHTGTQTASTISDFATESAKYGPVTSVSGRTGAITLAKSDVGLGNVDNTADTAKPVSTAQAAADTAVQAFAIQRTNHTGTQAASTISDFATESAKYGPVTSVSGRTGTVTISSSDVSGLASIATSGSASDLSAGTVPAARLPVATDTTAGAVTVGTGLAISSGVLSATGGGSYSLPTATDTVLGGVKVGAGLAISSGVLSATGGGSYSLPTATDTVLGGVKVGTGLAISSGVLSATGSGSYSLPTATSSVLGGIKVGANLTITDGVLAATGGGGSANIVEATTAAGFPATGASSTLYVATDASRAYRWSGSVYVEIGTSGGGSAGDGTDALLRSLLVPAAPTGVAATSGNAQASVSWTAPAALSVLPITDYTVQFSTNSGSTWTAFADAVSTATSATVTGLTNGTAYVFRVSATNGLGTSNYSANSSSATPAAAAVVPVTYSNKYGPGSYTITGTSTITATVTGVGYDNSDTRLWLLIGTTGTLSYSVTASSEGGYDGGRLYLTSASPAFQSGNPPFDAASIVGLTNVSAPVSGTANSSGTLSVTAGQYLVLRYSKEDSGVAGTDTITAVLSIA